LTPNAVARWRRPVAGATLVTLLAAGGVLVGVEPAAPISFNHPVVPARIMHRLPDPQHLHLNEVHTDAAPAIPGTVAPTWKYTGGHDGVTTPPTPAPSAPVFPTQRASAPALLSPTPSQPTPASAALGVPPRGQASAYGCAAALAYLAAYAAPGFQLQCPANAQGHQATTMCISLSVMCDLGRFIFIAVPCAAAYMNEASNSWVLLGLSRAPIDPYGKCW
jgi:hypothetical protein